MNGPTEIWLGYKRLGDRFAVRPPVLTGGVAALGEGANNLASLLAYASNEAGLKTVMLDLDGQASNRISGYMPSYGLQDFSYDSMLMDVNPSYHAQLLASAYACAMDLAMEQETTVNMVAQSIANESGVASPSALGDMLGNEDEERGRPSAKLGARFHALRQLNDVGEAGMVKRILEKSAVVGFENHGSPEASEVACALFIAKLLALTAAGEAGPDVVILTKANALFRTRPIFRQSQRLLATFVGAPFGKVVCSESVYALDQGFAKTSYSRILSSALWNEEAEGVLLTPNMFMFVNGAFGLSETFIPREFEFRSAKSSEASENPDSSADGEVLEAIASSTNATRESISAYLAPELGHDTVTRAIDRLQAKGAIVIVTKSMKGAAPIHVLTITTAGRKILEGKP